MPRQTKPRTCRRRLIGKRILDFVSTYDIDGNGGVPVTTARQFVKDKGISCPAVIKVKRNEYTTDMFFLAEKGMFGLAYAEFNWMLFPSLKSIYKSFDEREFSPQYRPELYSMDEEIYLPEFAFI
jgi:hypothetical protein